MQGAVKQMKRKTVPVFLSPENEVLKDGAQLSHILHLIHA